MPNGYSAGFNLSPFGGGGGGWNPFGGGMSMSYPGPAAGGGGGGWLGNALGFLGQGMMGANPVAMGGMAAMGLIPGIIGAFAAGNRQRKKEKWLSGEKQAYKQAVDKYFPEMSKESFQFQNPNLNNAIQGALGYRLGNMFGSWGMPQGMQQGAGNLNELFAAMMPPRPQGAGG